MEKMQDKKDMYKEVLVALSYFGDELIRKIPDKVFNKLKELAADSDIDVYIDTNKDLACQDISEQSKDMISLIYYICIADEKEKGEIFNLWKINDNKF